MRTSGMLSALLLGLLSIPLPAGDRYGDFVREDGPIGWWRMKADSRTGVVPNSADSESNRFSGRPVGAVELDQTGPDPMRFPDFSNDHISARFSPSGASLRISDSKEVPSPLKFTNGEEITLEAWVRPRSLRSVVYVIGKGRTHQGGFGDRNQNYSLRLARSGHRYHLSFFFCDADANEAARQKKQDGHRWTSDTGFALDGDWHHIAVVYRFGEPDSIRGSIDGRSVGGKWDLGGPTKHPPVSDNDGLWIGASMGGRSGVFDGELAEVALYRKMLPEERLRLRYRFTGKRPTGRVPGEFDPESIPADAVQVAITEDIPASRSWDFLVLSSPTRIWQTDRFAFTRLPNIYTEKGLIADYSRPLLLTASTRITISEAEAGEREFVLRALSAARLFVNGKQVAETPFQSLARSGHGKLHQLQPAEPGLLSLPAAHTERRVTLELESGEHTVILEAIVGHPGRVTRVGELAVGIARPGEPFKVLSPTTDIPFDDAAWLEFLNEEDRRIEQLNDNERRKRSRDEAQWWQRRHEFARKLLLRTRPDEIPVPDVENQQAVSNDIDRFIVHRLEQEGVPPAAVVDDLAFLRRVTLDVAGVIPTPEEIQTFLNDPAEERRQKAIDRLLADPRWADHWVSYWQDVLAENVGLAKPTLNNTGPFRFFLYDSFRDNKPIDRFVTELILMEGSPYGGGPAGFSLATQNDVPMAAKAHVIGTAFLGIEMKCARCHDSPLEDVTQKDLFHLAAMLARTSQKVPASSSIPGSPEELARMAVTVTLKPGTEVAPAWPFEELTPRTPDRLPAEILRNADDPREQLAALVTGPVNTRFAQVIVNRLWKRYLGRGLVEPVEEGDYSQPSHPELMDYLARELVLDGYDLKHMARKILNSQTYQRQFASNPEQAKRGTNLFASARERRMTAEQLVDSLYLAAGKPLDSEELTLDRDGRQLVHEFVSLGVPKRAWEMAGTSNDRDRPSTVLPKAQSVIDLLMVFGWRQTRPDPLTERDKSPTPLAPLALAHGDAAARVLDLSDASGITRLSLEDQPLDQLIERLVQRVLTRPPTDRERELFKELLGPGYETRIVGGPEVVSEPRVVRSPLSWSNNLNSEANTVAIEMQRQALRGDPPTKRLDPDWRTRMEEALWSLVNLPEFLWIP